MLSNPTNNLQNRRRQQHRRQNSTPTAFEAVKVNSLSNIPRHASHRRGMSLDQRRRQPDPQESKVITTNQGYPTTPQHILQETQQQRLARPGQPFLRYDKDENYLNSPIATPQRQLFETGCTDQYGEPGPASQYSYSGPINTLVNGDTSNFNIGNDFNLFSDAALTPSAFLDFSAAFETSNGNEISNNGQHSRRSSGGRRISGGIVDRVAQFESLALNPPRRPFTPPNQNVLSYFPPTPAHTPYDRMVKHEQTQRRFLESYDTSMEETIKPKSMPRARAVFEDMRKAAEQSPMPSPPRTGLIPIACSFDSAPMPTSALMNMATPNLKFMRNEAEFDCSQYSPVSTNPSPAMSYHSSPETPELGRFRDSFVNNMSLEAHDTPYTASVAHGLPLSRSSTSTSLHRRSESVSSINLEESITDTGITIDDIAGFIKGPDPVDGKWLCLYPDCKKRFGRKENIKSHVQTHLGDRQFQCPHCQKCFVRQHDLKRHAKIHSGVKPYPCQCGNSFARHDALTRHRQRGMCIGAFEGVVKKTVKRGRPRKNRPDNEERLKKSSRTRSKNKSISSASSTSGCSDSNSANSPFSDVDTFDGKPFADYDCSQSSSIMDNSSFHYSQRHSPMPDFVFPQAAQTSHSPAAFRSQSALSDRRQSIVSNADLLPSHVPSPPKSVHSQHHSPPGLCESTSSPTASTHYYDLDDTSNQGDNLTNLCGLTNISEHDDEMFLEAFSAASNDITRLERDPDLLMGKFDDVYGSTDSDDLFRNSSELFFGSP